MSIQSKFGESLQAILKGNYKLANELLSVCYKSDNHKISRYALLLTFKNKDEIKKITNKDKIWISKMAKNGNSYAQHNLGYMYDLGLGVTQDYDKAIKWYHLAAEQKYAKAQTNLGYIL